MHMGRAFADILTAADHPALAALVDWLDNWIARQEARDTQPRRGLRESRRAPVDCVPLKINNSFFSNGDSRCFNSQ